MRGIKSKLESHHGVQILDSSLVLAVKLADRYISTRFLPDKAIDVVDEACAAIRCELGKCYVRLPRGTLLAVSFHARIRLTI